MHRLHQHADVVAQDLAKNLVDLPRIALGPQRRAELALYDRERRLDVGPLVVMRQELSAVEREVVVHPGPDRIPRRLDGARLKRYERRPAQVLDQFHVRASEVRLVNRDLSDGEMLRGGVDQGLEEPVVVDRVAGYVHAGHDVGLDAHDQMRLEPLALLLLDAVLTVESAPECAGREARRAYREVRLDRLERQTARGDEFLEDARKGRVGEVVADRVEVRGL